MESEILQQLQQQYPTDEEQRRRLTELVDNFGGLSGAEAKVIVADILCLAKLRYESGNKRIVRALRRQILDLEDLHENDLEYMKNLEYLSKCLTSFKPAIFANITAHFSKTYDIDPTLVTCLPKVTGQQIGTKVEIKRAIDDTNPLCFYVKTHQEFSSKSHPTFLSITSDGTGRVDFKELFIYKVLEYIGYGPKTVFIIDKDLSKTRVEEGILIATQDLGYTKRPTERKKTFKLFSEVREDLSQQTIGNIAEATKRDIIAIDILSRSLLLEDVMINQGNFGIVTVNSTTEDNEPAKIKWKILDFMPPALFVKKGDDYRYSSHYSPGITIFHAFKVGNASHTYARDELMVIHRVLTEENTRNLWLPTLDRLTTASGSHLPFAEAMESAFADILSFMRENTEILQIKPERLARRTEDLERYRLNTTRNFEELEQGVRDYLAAQASSTHGLE